MTAVEAGSGSAHLTADPVKGIVSGYVDIAASPERVFRALSTDEQAMWWGHEGMYRTHDYEIDLRPGGKWSCRATTAKGDDWTVGGEYITVDPPRVLEYTWVPSWDNFLESRVRMEIEPTATGSRIHLTHTGFEGREGMTEGHTDGWNRVFGWLDEYVRTSPN
jgi:uncharacterized protein YndB with AHSA1/START domain